MYIDFNKNNDDFFNTSKLVENFKSTVEKQNKLYKRKMDEKIANASIKLFVESIIKHNLDENMTRIEHLYLISNENSNDVIDVFGSILFKSKDERSMEEFDVLKLQGIIKNYLDMMVFTEEKNYYSELKKEYIEYVEANKNMKKNKIK